MDVFGRWSDLFRRPDRREALDEGAFLIGACADPQVDVDAQLRRLDDLSAEATESSTEGLCGLLFDRLRFRGNSEDYGDPANSYLNVVLDRRLGIPITLSVLLIEVARRCGVTLQGVGMPGHFLVRDPAAPDLLIDCFNGGHRLDRSDCERLVARATDGTVRLSAEMLAPTGNAAILLRMLANLDRSFQEREDRAALAWVCELRLRVPEAPLGDRIQLAGQLATLGRLDVAATLMEEASSALLDGDPARTQLIQRAAAWRARLN